MLRPVSSRIVWLGACLALACSGPLGVFPGGRLGGEPSATALDVSALPASGVLTLETRPDDPYSVHVNYSVYDGALTIDPAEGRRWLDHLRADPRVRVRFDGRVYDMTAVLAGEPGSLPGFPADRFVYRLVARP